MIKNILAFVLLISSFTYAQHSVKGSMSPKIKTDWVILYKIEGTKQVFINNTTIKTDSIFISGKKQAIGTFEIKDSKISHVLNFYKIENKTFKKIF